MLPVFLVTIGFIYIIHWRDRSNILPQYSQIENSLMMGMFTRLESIQFTIVTDRQIDRSDNDWRKRLSERRPVTRWTNNQADIIAIMYYGVGHTRLF